MPSYNPAFDEILEKNIANSARSNKTPTIPQADNSISDANLRASVITGGAKPKKINPVGIHAAILDTPTDRQNGQSPAQLANRSRNSAIIDPKLAESIILDKVKPRFDGGTIIDGSRGVAGTGKGFDSSVITDFGQYGEQINGVDTLQFDMTDKMAAIDPKQRQDVRLAAILAEQGGNATAIDPDAARKLAILQQDTNIAGMKARADIESAGIGRFKQHEVMGEDLAGNPVKLPGGVFDSRTGKVVDQAALERQALLEAQQQGEAASQRAQKQAAIDVQRAQEQGQAAAQNGRIQATQSRKRSKLRVQQFNEAMQRYANDPEKLSQIKQIGKTEGLFGE